MSIKGTRELATSDTDRLNKGRPGSLRSVSLLISAGTSDPDVNLLSTPPRRNKGRVITSGFFTCVLAFPWTSNPTRDLTAGLRDTSRASEDPGCQLDRRRFRKFIFSIIAPQCSDDELLEKDLHIFILVGLYTWISSLEKDLSPYFQSI
jgi:hypothetical protein